MILPNLINEKICALGFESYVQVHDKHDNQSKATRAIILRLNLINFGAIPDLQLRQPTDNIIRGGKLSKHDQKIYWMFQWYNTRPRRMIKMFALAHNIGEQTDHLYPLHKGMQFFNHVSWTKFIIQTPRIELKFEEDSEDTIFRIRDTIVSPQTKEMWLKQSFTTAWFAKENYTAARFVRHLS